MFVGKKHELKVLTVFLCFQGFLTSQVPPGRLDGLVSVVCLLYLPDSGFGDYLDMDMVVLMTFQVFLFKLTTEVQFIWLKAAFKELRTLIITSERRINPNCSLTSCHR